MLPPVLEIYVIWHPDDAEKAKPIADAVIGHFHGDTFSGLLGGAVEVYVRSEGWDQVGGSPRPIPLPGATSCPGPAAFAAVLPLMGNGMVRAVRGGASEWADYLRGLVEAQKQDDAHVRILPAQLDRVATQSYALSTLLGEYQLAAAADPTAPGERPFSMLRRDLTQALTQFLIGSTKQIQVFISHTKRLGSPMDTVTTELIRLVREVVRDTRLGEFFDANSIQPGEDWAAYLVDNARTGAMLALRSDLYASREWCQREVKEAKTEGVPVVILDALERGENRGSFLLDHMPRMPARRTDGTWTRDSIQRALGLLVDECLKRTLWDHQQALAEAAGKAEGVDWWAPHAPEPLTLAKWLKDHGPANGLLILHPDPPLTTSERATLNQIAELAGLTDDVEVLTPRTLAARAG